MILAMENPVLASDDLADRIARRTLESRGTGYAAEVRKLLDAGREVMAARGTASRARVADIVSAAGLSNDAFYRHFASKDALVAAILQDGTERLHGYLAHQMDKEPTPEGKVRRWVEGVLAQAADETSAATTLAVLWNAGNAIDAATSPETTLAPLLEAPFAALGSDDPALEASLVAHAVVGRMSDLLQRGERPSKADVRRVVDLCLRAVRRGDAG
jgi:AcrR family transcriptional regulator